MAISYSTNSEGKWIQTKYQWHKDIKNGEFE